MLRIPNGYYEPPQPRLGPKVRETPLNYRIAAGHAADLNGFGAAPPRNMPNHDPQYKSPLLSGPEQSRIYYEWISSSPQTEHSTELLSVCLLLLTLPLGTGRPHNIVCTACRNPDNLLLCETCCRSYHAACLPAFSAPEPTGNFYCPSCKEKQWDRSPPQFTPSGSPSDASRSASPSVRERLASPLNHAAASDHGSPIANGIAVPVSHKSPVQPTPDVAQNGNNYNQPNVSSVIELYSRAKEFLTGYGGFPAHQEYSQELLLRVGWMMKEVEAQQALLREVHDLRVDNERLRNENAQFRTYLDSRLPSEAMLTASSGHHTPIPRSATDTAGKSWDSIVLDFI